MKRVYFLRRADGTGPIKIGCSWSPKARLSQLCSDYRAPLVILADAPGDFMAERNVLLKFAEHNVEHPNARGQAQYEWFAPVPELLSFIAMVKRTGIIPLVTGDCREKLMRDRYLGGETLEAIGQAFGVTRERVRQILRRTGCPSLGMRPEHCRSVVTPEVEAEIVRLGQAGHTPGEIKAALGLSANNVFQYLTRHGIKAPRTIKPRAPGTVAKAHAIAADYQAGLKTSEIAEKYGTQQPSIYRLLRIAGVEPTRLNLKLPAELPEAEIIADYRRGATIKALAASHGTTAQTIRLRLIRANALRSHEENEAIRIAHVAAANRLRRAA